MMTLTEWHEQIDGLGEMTIVFCRRCNNVLGRDGCMHTIVDYVPTPRGIPVSRFGLLTIPSGTTTVTVPINAAGRPIRSRASSVWKE